MNDEEKIKIGVEVAGNAPDVLESLRNSIRGLERDLRRMKGITIPNPIRRRRGTKEQEGDTGAQAGIQIRFDRIALRGLREKMALRGRMAAQRLREDRVAARVKQAAAAETMRAARVEAQVTRQAGATAMRDLRSRMSFQARMRRQKEAEEDAAAQVETRRFRDQARNHRYLLGLRLRHEREIAAERQRATRAIFDGFSGMRSSASQIRQAASAPVKAAAAGGLVAAGAVRTGIGAHMSTDTAETNLRMFGGEGISLMTQAQVKAVREGWLDKEALKNGMNVPAALNAYTEVLKAGIEKSQAADVTREILQATAGMDLNVPETTKLVGRLAQLTKGGPAEIGGMLNSMGIVAAETAADTEELVSSLRRGAGALANKNFKVSDLTAFTGVGISAGIQEGMAGTFIEHQQRDLLNAKYARGQEAKDLNKAFGMLGMGSRGSVSAATAKDPAGTLEKLYTKLGEIAEKDPVKANLIASLIGKDEWGGKMLMMAQSSGKIKSTRQAANDPNNKDFLSTLKGERLGSWAGMWNTTKATFQLFWEKFGAGFDGILRDVTTYFADLGQKFDWNRITLHVQAFMDGLKEGFGVRTWRELIDNIVGTGPGDFVRKLKDFGRGIAQGITSFFETIKTIGSSIGFDGKQSAQDIGKLVAQITLLSASLIVLAPVVSVLSLLAGGINLLVSALTAARGLLALLGIGSGAGTAVAAGGVAGAAAAGGVGTLAYLLGKYFSSTLPNFDKKGSEGVREDQSKGWIGQIWNKMLGRSSDGATVQRQSFYNDGISRSLIQNASLSSETGSRRSSTHAGSSSGGGGGGSVSYGGGSGALLLGQTPGSALGNVGIGRRGIIGGGANPSGMPDPGSGAGAGPYRGLLDHIARSEGTANQPGGGYNTSLGYGRYLPGGREQNLTSMSLNQVLALGDYMRRQPGNPNSSALGRYQIVGQTLRAQMRRLGLSGNEKFDEAMQDRLGAELARGRGSNPQGLANEWASLRGAKLQEAVRLAQGIPRGAPTGAVPSIGASIGADMKEAAAGWRHPLDGAGRLSSTFGMRRHPLSGQMKMHNGLDLAAPAGTAVKAMRDGVVSIGQSGDVTLKHPDGSSTTYRHAAATVAPGQSVAAGEIIARLRANDPRSTGPHLHLESRDAAGQLRDPQGILSASTRKLVDDFKSSGWKAGAGGNASAVEGAGKASLPSARMNPVDATRDVPLNAINSGEVGRRLDAGTPGGGGGGGGGGSPQINIVGHNGDPEALANAVQRRLSERYGRRTHETESNWG